jgi:VWFA-related protein
MRHCLVAVVAVLIILPLAAQFTERLDVRIHELEVVVETRDGKPVTNLQRDDFIVMQDGVQQAITNFSVINESSASAKATVTPTGVAPATPPANVERKPRKFVFFIDEFEMHDATRDNMLRQMSELVGGMDKGDEAMVITPSLPERIPLFFTPDKESLMSTLTRVTGEMMRKGDVQSLGSAALAGGEQLGRGGCGQSVYACSQERLQQLQSIARALSDVPGRKVLVVMTTIMTSTPGLVLSTPVQAGKPIVSDFRDLRRVVTETARIAAASNVTIYGLEAYEPGYSALPGVTSEMGRGSGGAFNSATGQFSPPEVDTPLKPAQKRGQEGTQDMLQTLASMTGAKA